MNVRAERFVINDATGAGGVRRAASQLAMQLGFNETDTGKLALVATEVAQNIFVHARSGEVLVRAPNPKTVEVLAIDKGPGMRDIEACMRDGFSTAGTQGMGLGMLTRMASAFDVYSRVDKGTVVFLEVRASDVAPDTTSNAGLPYGVICAPHAGETVVGDNWSVHAGAESWRALVVDGLGHGAFANEAAMEAVRVFESAPDEPAIDLMRRIHDALRKTRGAAGAILTFHPARSQVNFVGIGNIAATLLHKGKTRNMVSHNGTLGAEMRRIQEFTYPCPPDVLMLMFSDGLSSHWKLDGYPGLLHRHPSVIAAVLYRDFSRGRDDTTVLCARRNGVSKQ